MGSHISILKNLQKRKSIFLSFVIYLPFSQKCGFMCKPIKKWFAEKFWIHWYYEHLKLVVKQAINSNFPTVAFLEKRFFFAESKLNYCTPEMYEKRRITTWSWLLRSHLKIIEPYSWYSSIFIWFRQVSLDFFHFLAYFGRAIILLGV
jgi:hypothetical protein